MQLRPKIMNLGKEDENILSLTQLCNSDLDRGRIVEKSQAKLPKVCKTGMMPRHQLSIAVLPAG